MEQYEEANEDISKEVEGFAWRKYRFLVKKKKSITLNISRFLLVVIQNLTLMMKHGVGCFSDEWFELSRFPNVAIGKEERVESKNFPNCLGL